MLLDFESVTDIDPTASDALADAIDMVHAAGKVIGITRASAPVRSLLDRYGLTDRLGPDRTYASNREALTEYLDDPTV